MKRENVLSSFTAQCVMQLLHKILELAHKDICWDNVSMKHINPFSLIDPDLNTNVSEKNVMYKATRSCTYIKGFRAEEIVNLAGLLRDYWMRHARTTMAEHLKHYEEVKFSKHSFSKDCSIRSI